MWKYILVQFAGYMLQMLPPVFLFFAPFQDDVFRFSKRKILTGLCCFLIAASLMGSVFLGILYRNWLTYSQGLWIPNMIFSFCLLVGSIVYFISFRKGQQGKVLFYMLVVQYGITLYAIDETATRFIDVKIWEKYFPYGVLGVLIYAVATAVTLPPFYCFLKTWSERCAGGLSKKNVYLISVCAVIIAALTIIGRQMELGLYEYLETGTSKVQMSIWLVCFLFANLFSYFIYFGCLLIEREKEDMESKLLGYEMQYEHMRENIQNQKRRNHDLRHHFRTLSVLAHNGHTKEIQEYLKRYLEELEKVEARQICKNPIINNVLNYYIVQAEDMQVHMKYDIHVRENYPFDMMDMTVLLGNAMENALKACQECEREKAFVQVMIRQYKQSLLIQIENSVHTPENAEGKKDIERGIGLTNIDLVTQKYQGCMQAWQEKRKFILRVSLNI